jgi:hypothetical protein
MALGDGRQKLAAQGVVDMGHLSEAAAVDGEWSRGGHQRCRCLVPLGVGPPLGVRLP